MDAVLNKVPVTAAGFERDFNALKKDSEAVVKYLKTIPFKTIESYFKKTEINPELLSGTLHSINEKLDFNDNENAKWAGDFLISLSKSSNFSMSWMFASSKDKNNL